jgi:UTP--glucose-1-phosphate uridylyltransferase
VTKAVFPVAGLGSRFLPATKASPKEMMPVVDKPLIQYAVEEAAAAGINEMIFVTGRTKRAIEDHFDRAFEVESELAAKGKDALLDVVHSVIPKSVHFIFIRQSEPLGLGHAVLCAQPAVNEEVFAVILADDLIDAEPPALRQMTEVFERCQCPVVAVQEIPPEQSRQYGMVRAEPVAADIQRILAIVEKPEPKDAPSRLAVVGRYILTPRIFHHLAGLPAGPGGEIQLTDAISALLAEDRVLAYAFKGTRFDCGSKLGYLKATVAYGLKHPEVGADFARFLKEMPDGGAQLT